MKRLKKLLNLSKPERLESYQAFWSWFVPNAPSLFKMVERGPQGEVDFTHLTEERLNEIRNVHIVSVSMENTYTVEVVFSAEGNVENFVYIEQIVALAPSNLIGWKFTAFEQAIPRKELAVEMSGFHFDRHNLRYIIVDVDAKPHQVNIQVYYEDFDPRQEDICEAGMFLFLDKLLGELNAVCLIDSIELITELQRTDETFSIDNLPAYLDQREEALKQEFRVVSIPREHIFAVVRTANELGLPVIAEVNKTLLYCPESPAFSWVSVLFIRYPDNGTDGKPDAEVEVMLNDLEKDLLNALPADKGYLFLGQDTGAFQKTLYFAAKDYREVSIITSETLSSYLSDDLQIIYSVFRDKYWDCLDDFREILVG